ncbi:MAG TPA: hypothetical protein VK458_25985 [Myxococcaceae bacterium]|nr:hypothetical protein [Myxococcaceae bacterium]
MDVYTPGRPSWYVPTALALQGVIERKAISRGVRIAFGTDAGVFSHGRNAEEFALLADSGMKPATTRPPRSGAGPLAPATPRPPQAAPSGCDIERRPRRPPHSPLA